ncbi:hypothetical protein BHM03_00039074 [Ensete ventricosum]|nr:hypothetical protein BHM03_00039074 [Ensete ventricosum]
METTQGFVGRADTDEPTCNHTDHTLLHTTAYYSSGSGKDGHMTGYVQTTEEVTNDGRYEYRKEKQHKHREHLGEMGALAAEHARRHKMEEEIAAATAVGSGGYAAHERHERKEAKEQAEEAHGKKHHHFF